MRVIKKGKKEGGEKVSTLDRVCENKSDTEGRKRIKWEVGKYIKEEPVG